LADFFDMNIKEKKIIFFTPIVPLPPIGSGTRSFYIISALAKIGLLDIVVFSPLDSIQKKALESICNNVYSVKDEKVVSGILWEKLISKLKLFLPFFYNNREISGWLNALQLNVLKLPYFIRFIGYYWISFWIHFRNRFFPSEVYRLEAGIDSMNSVINSLLNTEKKILVFDLNYFIPLFKEKFDISNHIIIGNSHNSEADLLKQDSLKKLNNLQKSWLALQIRSMIQAEKKSIELADFVFCCSNSDINHYSKLSTKKNFVLIPNGVDTGYFKPENCQKEFSLLFTGTMSYYPNTEGISWFLNKVFPHLLKKFPLIKLIIAGRKADELGISSSDNISIVSDPDDIRPFFNKSMIYIVPLLKGGGTRLKILEAASMGLPIVSTSIGMEGLDGLNETNIFVANDAITFCNKISFLIEHPETRADLSNNLENWVHQNYTWDQISKKIQNSLIHF
jgi:glycosyltransferase involved in cell wall biosynthesis